MSQNVCDIANFIWSVADELLRDNYKRNEYSRCDLSFYLHTAVEEYGDKLKKMVEKVEQQIELLREYKQSFITHAMTGKIDIREVGR